MAKTSLDKVNRSVYYVWTFNYQNVNKETGYRSSKKMQIGVRGFVHSKRSALYPHARARSVAEMRKAATQKFEQIMRVMYPRADQVVTSIFFGEQRPIYV